MWIPDIIGEALWYAKVEGWPFLLRKILRMCLSFFFEFRTCSIFRRDNTKLMGIEPRIDVEARLATPDDLALLEEIAGPRRLKLFKERFRAGRICFVAFHKGRLIAFQWCALELDPRLEPIPFDLSLRPHEAYIYDMFVLPEYRRKLVFEGVRDFRYKTFKEIGVQSRVWWVHVDNVASFTRLFRVPILEQEIVYCLKVLWFRKTWKVKALPNSAAHFET